ncbi:MAG: hypothetical protein EOO10_09230 [Chitinophagaceae bacterium]|nr:MAG: hypothetical protein EOO10_09230 [Chitinophagaceae bacterium]
MKYYLLLCSLATILFSGCNLREREASLKKKEDAISEKEQLLLLKEKTLQLKEEELAKRQHQLDSTYVLDTTAKINPNLVGTWSVQMSCTETTCQGSAVGDTKTESWELTYQDKNVIAKAKVNNELVRVYSGAYNGTTLELVETQNESVAPATKIVVHLRLVGDTRLEGQREIERLNESCKIVYAMVMDKK